jgi:hypothetical protein
MSYWTKLDFKQLFLKEDNFIGPLNIKVDVDGTALWEFSSRKRGHVTPIVILSKDDLIKSKLIGSLERTGTSELMITNMSNAEQKKTNQAGWEEWFISHTTLGFSSLIVSEVQLVPDTNFVKMCYGSGLLRRLGAKEFGKLQFSIPNLVVLEIEAIYNRAKLKANSPKCKDIEKKKANMEMQESLLATKELMFLRHRGLGLLPTKFENSTIENFSTVAGKGMTDLFIRSEIRNWKQDNIRFMTCDLMNSLAATAEGIPTFYFSRIGDEFHLSAERDVCMGQVADLIVDNTVLFGNIDLMISSSTGFKKLKLTSRWNDWTPIDLLNDKVVEVTSS